MLKRILPLILILSILQFWPITATPNDVEAGTVGTFTFTITGSMPTISQPDPTFTTTTTPCSDMLNFGRERRFEVYSFVAPSSGVYDFVTTNVLSGTNDNELLLYQNAFVPNDQSGNCMFGNDDDGAAPEAAIRGVNLVAGRTYFLVGFPKFESVTAGILSDTTFEVNVSFVAALQAVGVCDGNDLNVVIQNGDGPFTVAALVNGIPATLTGLSIGTHTIAGPASFTNTSVTEESLDNEVLNLPDRNCPPPPPGITVTPGGDTTVDEANLADTATFDVVLQTQPGANVFINIDTDGQCTITSPFAGTSGTLVFTDTTGTTPQTVTTVAVDDFVDEASSHPCDIVLNMDTVNTLDPGYAALDPDDVQITVLDNDTAGIAATPNTVSTDESGTTDTFDVTLTSQPADDVVLTVTSQDTSEGAVDVATLTFMTGNWNVPQTVTVTGIDDDVDDGDITFDISLGVDTANTTDALYKSLAPTETVSVTNTDDDTAGVTVVELETPMETSEAGDIAQFTVVLDSEPTDVVEIDISSSNTAEGTADKVSLQFTPGNWDTSQTVTVTGVDEDVDDGDVVYTIELSMDTASTLDAIYDGIDPADVNITNIDDDGVGVIITPLTVTTNENGSTDTFDVVLASQPTGNVLIDITSLDTGEGVVDKATLTFLPGTWNIAQTVTVTGVDDTIKDGDVVYQISTTIDTVNTTDPLYDPLTFGPVTATNVDDDIPNVVIVEDAISTNENGTAATFDVLLNTQPTDNVTVQIAGLDSSEGTLSDTGLNFTTGNWDVAQTVTVTGVDDGVDDGDILYTLTATSSSVGDADYAAGLTDMLDIINIDDDTSGVLVDPTTGLRTDEGGSSDSFNVVLTSQPTGAVVISLSSSDATEGTVSPAMLTFSTSDWDITQMVTVTGIDDNLADGDVSYTILISIDVGTTDPLYATLDPDNVNVTNVDNDTGDLIVSPLLLLVAEDAPGDNGFSVRLGTPPQSGEVVTIIITYDATQLDVSPIIFTFDSSNYNLPQFVAVDAIPDGVDEPLFDSLIVVTSSSNIGGTLFNGLTETVTVSMFDYKAEIITHVPNHGLIRIDTTQGQRTYGSPSEGVAREPDGREIWLPQDYDGNGFDTFVVTDIRIYNGQTWFGLWQGTMNWLWVPYNLDMMSIVEPLDWHIQSEWTP